MSWTLTNNSFTRTQHNSPLLCLPAELRNTIYTFLFSSLPILICFATSHVTRLIDSCPIALSKRRRWSHMHYSRLLLSLTEACWQTYAETRLLPFVLNTFTGYPEALVSGFPGRLYRDQFECISTVQLVVESRDISREEHGRVRGERVGLSPDMCMVLEGLRSLTGLRTLRVVWEGDISDIGLWEQFRNELPEKVAG